MHLGILLGLILVNTVCLSSFPEILGIHKRTKQKIIRFIYYLLLEFKHTCNIIRQDVGVNYWCPCCEINLEEVKTLAAPSGIHLWSYAGCE